MKVQSFDYLSIYESLIDTLLLNDASVIAGNVLNGACHTSHFHVIFFFTIISLSLSLYIYIYIYTYIYNKY